MQISLTTKLLRFCFIKTLLISAIAGWALEPSLNAGESREEPSIAQSGSRGTVTCRFKWAPDTVPQQSTCIAEHLTPTFYRQIASCRGVNSCVLNVPSLVPIRLWSPDSRNQATFAAALPPTYTFQVFPRAAKATKGPWISAATQKAVVVRWETDAKASSWLRVVNDQFSPPHTAQWIEGKSSCPGGAAQPCIHTAILTGLDAGRRYRFVLGDVVPTVTTGQHPGGGFVTEPVVIGGTEYSFSVVGDVQGQGDKVWKDVADYSADLQMNTGRPGGPILHTGDLTASLANWKDFFSLGAWMLSSHPFYPAMGNNDNQDLFLRYFGPTGRIDPTGYDLEWKPYYSVNYGNTHFIVLDTNSLTSCTNAQATWLRNDLKGSGATTAENIVIVTHWGPRGYGVYGDNTTLKSCLESLFRDSSGKPTDFFRKLRMVFSGHQHYYERISQSHTVGTDTRKVHYVTVGTAAADPRCPGSGLGLEASSASVCKNPGDPSSDGTYDYQGVVVDVRGRVFELRAYNFAYDAAGKRVPKGPSGTWYSVLDCFAMNDKGEAVPPQNACKP